MAAPADLPWITHRQHDLCWSFAPAWLEAVGGPGCLLGWHGLRLGEWLAAGQAQVIKQTPHRAVYRVTLPGGEIHVKHYRGDGRERWRCLLRGSKARGEAVLTCEVARRGVPTLEVLGFGESPRWAGGDSYLITRTLPDAVPLVDFLEGPLAARPAVRQQLAVALGDFLATKHRAGVRHDDLHAGNLLVRMDEHGVIRLYLIDLHAVHLGGPLPWAVARSNLVILDRWFLLHGSRCDRLRALMAYCHGRPELAIEPRQAAQQTHELTAASFVRFSSYLDRRADGGNRHFRRFQAGGQRGVAVSDLDEGALAAVLTRPDERIDRSPARVLKRSASSAVVEIELCVAGATRTVILKRQGATAWSDPLRGLFREPPASWAFRMGHALRGRGLPTPRPLAVWHRCRAGMPADGYLLVEKVPDAVDLGRFVAEVGDPHRLRRLIEQCARLVRQMHERGLSHRDLKAANLLVSPAGWSLGYRGLREQEGAASGDRVWFIDLVGVRRHRQVTRARRVQNLARLHMSFLDHPALTRTDRLRFLRTYLAWALAGRAGWKGWWKEVDEAARAKVRRNRRLGRVVG